MWTKNLNSSPSFIKKTRTKKSFIRCVTVCKYCDNILKNLSSVRVGLRIYPTSGIFFLFNLENKKLITKNKIINETLDMFLKITIPESLLAL